MTPWRRETGELHNMSVPPRSALTVRRATLRGRRYRIDPARTWPAAWFSTRVPPDLTLAFRQHGALCAAALLDAEQSPAPPVSLARRVARMRNRPDAVAWAREACRAALAALALPPGMGFFVEDTPDAPAPGLGGAAAIALLAARSGPLYLPGRFEPSLIRVVPVTLFFPFPRGSS